MQIELTEKDLALVAAYDEAQSRLFTVAGHDVDAYDKAKALFTKAGMSLALTVSVKVELHRELEDDDSHTV